MNRWMQAPDDMGLLREYAWGHSEQAFATPVARHIDLVYSAAFRHLGNHRQAEEITQAATLSAIGHGLSRRT
ncbi:MAG TPA: hypothetical protein VN578_01725 [Candidatus Binatia bacterium]|nr:hypothetical protein [Candidatus Binatia bacterium]